MVLRAHVLDLDIHEGGWVRRPWLVASGFALAHCCSSGRPVSPWTSSRWTMVGAVLAGYALWLWRAGPVAAERRSETPRRESRA